MSKTAIRSMNLYCMNWKRLRWKNWTEAGENDRVHPDETAEQYALTETLVIRADWTEEREEPVNYGNGSHSRYYVCGRTEEDPVWRDS